jgi:hypothetical protein
MSVVPVFAVDSVMLGYDGNGGSNSAANYVTFTRSQAAASGIIHSLRVYSVSAGNLKIALYNGSSSAPTTLLQATSGVCGATANNTFTIPDTSIVSGQYYWIGVAIDTTGTSTVNVSGGVRSYLAITYGSYSFPSTFSHVGFTDDNMREYATALGIAWNAPSITTNPITGYYKTSAIVNENITAQGDAAVTQRGFDYGLTTAYGSSSVITNTFANGVYSSTLVGLTPSTQYHYRAKAYNGAWGYGADGIFSTTGSPAIEYYFQTTADNQTNIYGANWASQTFTTDNATAKTVTSVTLLIDRVGSPGYITVSLRDTAGGVPTGQDIAAGSILGDNISTTATWYSVPMVAEKPLNINTQYAIVVRATSADGTSYIQWKFVNAGGFADGNGITSVNSGVAWTAKTWDYNFEVWGNSCIQIQSAKVFQSYSVSGDWLIVCRYINVFPPYYPNEDIKRYFAIQLVDSTGTVLASNSIPEWGNRIGSIYLSAAQVAILDWNGAYKVRIQGLFTGSPYVEYSLIAGDWLGTDLTYLDSWAISSANVMAIYDTVTTPKVYVSNIATRGAVLSSSGGDLLVAGCPGLQTVRPALFQIYTASTAYTPQSGAATFANTSRTGTAIAVGPDAVTAFGRLGQDALGGIPFNYVIAIVAVVVCFGLAGATFPFGHTTAANVLCLGILFAFGYFGFDWIWIGMIYAVSVFLLAKKLWIDTGI